MVAPGQQRQEPSRLLPNGLRGLLDIPEASILLVALIVIVVIEVLKPSFLGNDAQLLLNDTARYGLFAVGEAMLMITGEIDLSAAKIFSTTPFIAYYLTQFHVPFPLACLVAMVGAGLIGMVNGMLRVFFNVPSLIATLGMLFFLNGLTLTISNSHPVTTPISEPFNTFFGEGQQVNIGGPSLIASFLWLVLLVSILAVALRRTRFGLHTIAVGSNLLAAREIGIRIERVKITNFVIMGLFAGFGGIIEGIVSTNIDPTAGDNNYALYGIAAAVIGGTSLTGGSGTVIGALIGAFVIALLIDGLPFVGANAGFSDTILGLAIVVAMILNLRLNRPAARK